MALVRKMSIVSDDDNNHVNGEDSGNDDNHDDNGVKDGDNSVDAENNNEE